MPFLSSSAGDVWMSWLEPTVDERHSLRVSSIGAEGWTEPRTVATRSDFFVNWADFPSVSRTPNGTLITHWLQKSGAGTYSYDVMLARSVDDGQTWSEPVVLHDDGVEAEHGFLSFAPMSGDRVAAVWLDGRKMTGDHGHGNGSMTVRFAEIGTDGSIGSRAEIDARVCECCQTGLARSADAMIAVYRNRSEDEVRDIGYSIYRDGEWSESRIVHEDGWQIRACPVNGPRVDANDQGLVAVAWFTGANDQNQVRIAFSTDRGESFGDPITVDAGLPLGRVDVRLVSERTAVVSWLRDGGGGMAKLMVREIGVSGDLGDPVVVGTTSAARSSGFPRMTRVENDLYVAYTRPDVEANPIQVSKIMLKR